MSYKWMIKIMLYLLIPLAFWQAALILPGLKIDLTPPTNNSTTWLPPTPNSTTWLPPTLSSTTWLPPTNNSTTWLPPTLNSTTWLPHTLNCMTGLHPTLNSTTWLLSERCLSRVSPKTQLDLILTVRTLVLFSAHEVNRELRAYPRCVPRWVNPLTASQVSRTQLSGRTQEWRVRFDLEPGRVPYEAVLRQEDISYKPVNLSSEFDEELRLMSLKRLDGNGSSACGYKLDSEVTQTCLCGQEAESARNRTDEARRKWNLIDPEVRTWPIQSSFFVSTYVNYSGDDFFLISPARGEMRFCGQNVRILIYVITASTHFDRRDLIRRTYGHKETLHSKGVRLLFSLGTVSNGTLQALLKQESAAHDDLVQANFLDTYHNLSLKVLSMYNWIRLTCGARPGQMPTWILQVDDDVLLNVDLALEVAMSNPESNSIGCLFCGTTPIRDFRSTKYYMPRHIYQPNTYLGYLSGMASLIRTEETLKLLRASLFVPMLHIEDIYTYGLLPRHIRLHHEHSPYFTYKRTEPDACLLKKTAISYVLGLEDMKAQWEKLIQSLSPTENCSLPTDFKVKGLTQYDKDVCFYE